MSEFTYGCDPELFLFHKTKGYISAAGLFPGTKENPFPVEKGAVQVDGFALEFNINPAKTADEFSGNIETVLTQMKEMVSKVDKELRLEFRPLVTFDVKYFNSLPEENKVLGCDPDYRASDGSMIIINEALKNKNQRTAAGHVHIGWTKDEDPFGGMHFQDCKFVAQHFYSQGTNPLHIPYSDDEANRLMYYGHSGAFRPKSYGVELRQYSNRWVEKPENRKKMFNFLDTNVKSLYKG